MDDEEEESNVFYGTPLPDYEDEASLRKKAAREQEVCDEKGRRRFHGAFTGGFSAGYFNTVGTKEGWTPSAFISSKNKTTDHVQQNPEDFMDEEDFGAFGIATKRMHTTSQFQDTNTKDSTKKQNFLSSGSTIPGEAPLKSIVQPVNESIGVKILKRMGWRLGQGIGPRIKKQSSDVKTYGCSAFPQDIAVGEEDPTMLMFTFAPDDTDSVYYDIKDNCFGLGYTGLSKKSVLDSRIDLFAPTSTVSFLKKDKKKLRITGQAFGVGAYEDEDEDIYSKDDMSQYDFSDMTLPVINDPKKCPTSGRTDKSSDIILEGFCLSSKPAVTKKKYSAPVLPPNFKPIHPHIMKPNVPQQKGLSRGLSAESRSLILGENKFRSADNRNVEKTAVVTLNASNKIASSSFVPFSNDKEKQRRYDEYLKLRNSGEIEKIAKPFSMTEWEHQQELEEFSKASTFFKPLSMGLSLRFESRSQLDVEHEVMSALQKIKTEKVEKTETIERKKVGSKSRKIFEWHPASLLCRRFNVPNPYPNSDGSGVPNSQKLKKTLFDHLASVCAEETDKCEVTTNQVAEEADVSSKESMKTQQVDNTYNNAGPKSMISAEGLPPTNSRPPMDLFKDIFENSSSDEENSENEEKLDEKANTSNPSIETQKAHKNLECSETPSKNVSEAHNFSAVSKKVGFGVFANLDLDALNKRTPIDRMKWQGDQIKESFNEPSGLLNSNSDGNEGSQLKELSETVDDDVYGPELPPQYSGDGVSKTINLHRPSSHSNSGQVDCNFQIKKDKKKHSKHKVKHKHKHHKHKSERKRKRKHSRKDSESDNSSDSEDIPPSLIIEKLKKLKKV